jgi:hypothetical protein
VIGRVLAVVVASVVVTAGAQTPPPTTPVTSATVRMIRKPVDVQFIHIENLRKVPLLEIKLALIQSTMGQNFAETQAGPIAPGDTRRVRAQRYGTAAPSARVTLAVFADGSHVGAPDEVAAWRQDQQALVEDLSYWQKALSALPRSSPLTAQVYVRERMQERQKAVPGDPSAIRQRLSNALSPVQGPSRVFVFADATLLEIAQQLAAATPFQKHLTSDISAVDQAVGVRAAAGQGSDFVAVVQNLRAIRLEAWSLEFYDPPTSRFPRAGNGFDAGSMLEDGRPGGRLNLNETREMHFGQADDLPDAAMPRAALALALWDDLTWEGSADARARTLRSREQVASPMAFWIPVLEEASQKPAADALTFLRAKQAERRQQAPDEHDFLNSNLPHLAQDAATRPADLPAALIAFRDRLVVQHRQLTRHLQR